MNPTALYFASGESLYLGAALLLLVMVASPLVKRTWLLRLRNVVARLAYSIIFGQGSLALTDGGNRCAPA